MYQITFIQVSQKPPSLGTITDYYFEGRNGESTQWFNKPAAVTYVRNNPDKVYVHGGGVSTFVEIVENGAYPYLRTRGDGTTSDNLLSLPVIE